MTRDEFKRYFPNASEDTIRKSIGCDSVGREPSGAESQQVIRDALPPARDGAPQNSPRYAVRITSFRNRLCDPDNLCGKYFVDCLRYAGILPDDTAAIMDYSIRQEKTPKGSERTEIEVTKVS